MTGIGAPLNRLDGPAKVTGAARFAADLPAEGVLEGRLVVSPVAAGRVAEIDETAARAVPGLVEIFTAANLPPLDRVEHWALGQTLVPIGSDEIAYAGQPVALVLAETRAAASEAVHRLRVGYEAGTPTTDRGKAFDQAVEVEDWAPTSTSTGDVDRGLDAADVTVEGEYRTASRHHAALEPAIAVARWRDGELELWTSTQWVFGVRAGLAQALGVPAEAVRVRAAHVGGGFGAKGSLWPHEILAAHAARAIGRPVRIELPRSQGFTAHGYQPETFQRVTLGARRDGALLAIRHESVNVAALGDDYVEHGSLGTRSMYACPAIATRDRILRLSLPQPTFMRAPHEGPGMVALEIAMDELAERLALDPLELRLRNYAETDPTSGKPFSSKALRECYAAAASRFGWARRSAEPGSMRDGDTRIGWGMASALMASFRFGATARVTLARSGDGVIETAAHDIGTGLPTILPQIAGEALGIDPGRLRVELADTALPEAGGTFGSSTTMSVGAAVQAAAVKLRRTLEAMAGEPDLRPEEYGDLMALRRLEQVSEVASWAPRREDKGYAMNAYGAVFVEVGVDPDLPMPRVRRVVGSYSVGRLINPVTARSQVIGGVVWGLGQALLERSPIDAAARFIPTGLASYRMPGHVGIPAIDVHFAPESDPIASPLGARGVGEIGTIGVGAAVANAVYHATGIRVRSLPVMVEHLIGPTR